VNRGSLDPLAPAFLSQKTFARFDGSERSSNLSGHCLSLLSEQRKSWQELKNTYESLKTVRTKSLSLSGFSVLLYYNPGRILSATAAVRREEVKDRPCFLCRHNLPHEQKWILYRNEYRILCNPRPVLERHFTITHIEHRPQAISENFDTLLNIMADLGHGWITLYNGPRCGASAPDHLHFQTLPTGYMPIEYEIYEKGRLVLVTRIDDVSIFMANDLGREILLLKGDNQASLTHAFSTVLATFKRTICSYDEPMMNIAGFYDAGSWHIALFPRQKHRPDVFYREGDERIIVSPGVVEMAGILVTPMEADFERLNATTVEAIYREVSIDSHTFANIINNVKEVGRNH